MKKLTFLLLAFLSTYIISVAQNVGIGTTTPHPNAILELKSVNKGLLLPRGDAATRNPGLKDNTAKGLLLFDTLSGTLWVHNGDGTPLGWHEVQDDANGLWRRSGNDIVNNNIGNVGIGINSTLSRLYVNGLAGNTNPVIKSQVNYVGNTDVRGIEVMSNPNPGYGIGLYAQGGYLGVWANGNPNGSSSVSYGVFATVSNTVSSVKYGLYGSANGPGNNYGGYFNASGGTTNYSVYANDGNMYVSDSVWIGKTTGVARFDMTGGKGDVDISEGDFRIGTPTNRLKMGVYTSGVFAGWSRIHSSGTNAILVFGNNGMDVMSISPLNNGTVIIGNGAGVTQAAAGYKLSVHGKAVCTELMVKSVAAWPDYVFNEEYKLMPLTELDGFIRKNKHLPNISNAATIEKEGLLVGEMQKKLVEKIEELTLYIIEQQKRLDAQDKKIETLQKQITQN